MPEMGTQRSLTSLTTSYDGIAEELSCPFQENGRQKGDAPHLSVADLLQELLSNLAFDIASQGLYPYWSATV